MSATIESLLGFRQIVIDRSPKPMLDEETQRRVDAAWSELCAQNPKYFNAPILTFETYDAQSGVLSARVDEYKHHAVRQQIDLGISLLAVTACLARPRPDATYYLLGQRSARSHMYGGLWELGPSGGIEPADHEATISFRGLLNQVDREVREEIGISVCQRPAAAISLVHDAHAGSTDIHVGIVLGDEHKLNPNWEYDDTRWVTLDDLIEWCEAKPDEIIPTTIAHARFLQQNRS